MDELVPSHVPVYRTEETRRRLWERCVEHNRPVIAVREATRGYIVRYDLQHLDTELDEAAVRQLRDRTRRFQPYPTGMDPLSESEGVGGEAGPISGDLHAPTEADARTLAAQLSSLIFDQTNWQA